MNGVWCGRHRAGQRESAGLGEHGLNDLRQPYRDLEANQPIAAGIGPSGSVRRRTGGGTMVPLWAFAILAGTSAAAILVMLAVRRYWAPEGFLRDAVPATGVFGVLGVAFAVLLAFVLFLAFEG